MTSPPLNITGWALQPFQKPPSMLSHPELQSSHKNLPSSEVQGQTHFVFNSLIHMDLPSYLGSTHRMMWRSWHNLEALTHRFARGLGISADARTFVL